MDESRRWATGRCVRNLLVCDCNVPTSNITNNCFGGEVMPLKHLMMTIEEENRFYEQNPGVHLVKAIVVQTNGNKPMTHIWVSDNRRMNGGNMQSGGARNDE